jgi:superfamily II DNA or RNA helicase
VAGGLIPRFILGGARWTADELLAHMESTVVIGVDAEALVITLAPLDAAVLALVQALQRHPSVFPEESHRELRRRLGALQHAIELHLPETLAGNTQRADSRPVVRLTLEDDAGLVVEIGVRPVPGAVFGPPGEGSRLALGAVDGLHVSARRDLARERASAERLPARLTLDAATREGRWRYRLNGEERILAVVEALAELGTEVVVEWPKDARAWRWVGRATPRELRVHVGRKGDLLSIEGDVEIDGHRVALATLLEAIAQGRRYVVVGSQMFIGLAAELRERLAAAAELLHAGREGLEAGLAAAPVLADLEDEQRATDAAWRSLRERTAAARALDPELPAGLHADLRPYQLEGFRWLARLSAWAAGACLADDMGLGKTVQTLALLVHRAALGPALVIAPISVTSGWISEAARFAPGLRVLPYRGTDREALLSEARPGDLFIAGYGVVTRDLEALAGVRFSTLVLDEAHLIKNIATRRARAVGQLQADFRVALTGTPVENHLGELWNLFRVISPGLLGTWPQFRERFAAPIERDQSAERRAALGRVLRPFMLRRTKESVLPELPPLTELNRLVSLSAAERELYETARLAATTAITAPQTPKQRFAVLGWLTRLRRLSCHPRLFHDAWTGAASKLDAFLALVEELRATGHRALVFSQFTDHLALVREALRARGVSSIYLDGSTPLDERARAVESFQRGEGDLFLISLKAGGTGLNLTAADHVIHLDPWWNPAVEDQATDRAHRIGQSRPVTVIRLIAQGTIEEAVLALHAEKRELAERLLDGTDRGGATVGG